MRLRARGASLLWLRPWCGHRARVILEVRNPIAPQAHTQAVAGRPRTHSMEVRHIGHRTNRRTEVFVKYPILPRHYNINVVSSVGFLFL